MQKIDVNTIVTEQAPDKYINGRAWRNRLVNDEAAGCTLSVATFEAGSRTHWHWHPTVQILIADSGVGYVQKKGEKKQFMHPGDVVVVFTGEEHWHGATPNSMFTHTTIQMVKDDATITGVVNEKQYSE